MPNVCSTTQRFAWGTKPLPAGLRSTTCTSMPMVAPWATTELLNPWPARAVVTAGVLAATWSSSAVPAVFSCADAARTTTAMTSPQDIDGQEALAPGHLLAVMAAPP
jgi:hypothetical protein